MLRNVLVISGMIAALAMYPAFFALPDWASATPDAVAPPTPTKQPTIVARAELPRGKAVRIEGDERGHYFGEFRINGRKVKAMIDTGATAVAISASTARRLGIAIGRADFKSEIQTANGKGRAAILNLETVAIGKIKVHDVEAMVIEDDLLEGALIGMSFLNRLRRFESRDGVLTLVD